MKICQWYFALTHTALISSLIMGGNVSMPLYHIVDASVRQSINYILSTVASTKRAKLYLPGWPREHLLSFMQLMNLSNIETIPYEKKIHGCRYKLNQALPEEQYRKYIIQYMNRSGGCVLWPTVDNINPLCNGILKCTVQYEKSFII